MFDSDYFYSSPPSDISSDVTEPELRACQSEIPDWRVEREDCRGSSQQLSQCSSKPQGTSLTRKLRNGLFIRGESNSSHIDILIGFADRVHLHGHIFSASSVKDMRLKM